MFLVIRWNRDLKTMLHECSSVECMHADKNEYLSNTPNCYSLKSMRISVCKEERDKVSNALSSFFLQVKETNNNKTTF